MRDFIIHGVTNKGYEPVREQFEKNFRQGIEENAQLCVYLGEKMVVNLWGESTKKKVVRNERTALPYNEDSLAAILSCSKVLTAICVARLVEKGLLNYTDTVMKHWPEFVNGNPEKELITIENILRHEAGMHKLSKTLSMADLLRENIKNNNSIGCILEKQALRFPPAESETRMQYHAHTYGYLLNEIIRRVDPNGRTIGECLREEICIPLNVAAHIGLNYEELPNCSPMCTLAPKQVLYGSFRPKCMGRKVQCSLKDVFNSLTQISRMKSPSVPQNEALIARDFHAIFNGAFNSIIKMGEAPGFGAWANAKSLARIAAMMANGGAIDGVRILSESTWKAFHEGEEMKPIYPLRETTNFTQGGINIFDSVKDKTGRFKHNELRKGFNGWMAFGGSVMQWHPEHKIGFAYIPTFLCTEDPGNKKGALLQKAVVECIENIHQDSLLLIENGHAEMID